MAIHPEQLTDPPYGGDATSSPYTGFTRHTWQAIADATLAAVRPHASPGHALIDLPGPASLSGRHSDGLEGFARTFLLAGFRLSAGGADPHREADPHSGAHSGGASDPGNLAEWYAAGVAAGTDPASPDRWPDIAAVPQARVECASLAIALHESRRVIWDRLDDPVRQRVVDWMSGIAGAGVPDNNWVWFRAVSAAFLRSVGAPYRSEDIEHAIARTEQWYVGDGWYSDGPERTGQLRGFDSYNGWAMHFYPLWYCRMAGAQAPAELRERYRGRLRRFLADAQHLIGSRGAPVLQGRSLTYRYAMLAPFWAGAVFDASPLAPGLTRHLASAVLRHFIRAGCFDAQGLQTIGWYRQFPQIRQGYSGPGSPYWSSKGFAGLVLPADHPVWTDTEEPTAAQLGDVSLAMTAPGWVVSSTSDDGVVRVAGHGGDHWPTDAPGTDDEVYARLGYSSHAAPVMGEGSRITPVDSHAALVTMDGRPSHRRPALTVEVAGHRGVSRYRAHWPVGDLPDRYGFDQAPAGWTVGPWLTVASVLRGPVEVRLCRIDPAAPEAGGPGAGAAGPELGGDRSGWGWPADPGPWRLRLGGWALADAEAPTTQNPTWHELDGDPDGPAGPNGSPGPEPAGPGAGGHGPSGHGPSGHGPGSGIGVWRADGLCSAVVGLHGLPDHGVDRHEDANALGRHCAVPWLSTSDTVTYGTVYAAMVVLFRLDAPDAARRPAPVAGQVPAPPVLRVEHDAAGADVEIRWPDGTADRLRLDPPPGTLTTNP